VSSRELLGTPLSSPALACGRLRSPALVLSLPMLAYGRRPSPAVTCRQTPCTTFHVTFLLFMAPLIIYYFRYLRISTYTPALAVILILSSSDPC
jgi:hypothetical protein